MTDTGMTCQLLIPEMNDYFTDEKKELNEAPKMPRKIANVHKQILAHPKYPELSAGTKFAFEMGCVEGFSWRARENNKWSREIWRHLYLGEKLED